MLSTECPEKCLVLSVTLSVVGSPVVCSRFSLSAKRLTHSVLLLTASPLRTLRLCGEISESLFALICVNLRLKSPNALRYALSAMLSSILHLLSSVLVLG